MERFSVGDCVRVDIPDETDPDYSFHGEHGVIDEIILDDAEGLTGDSRGSVIYQV